MFFFKPIEKLIYTFRNVFWEYPDFIFFGKKSLRRVFLKFYSSLRPFSHIMASIIFLSLITAIFATNFNLIVRADTTTLIEGVLVGVDETGKKNTIQKLNPMVIANTQIEKDLNELIYESLVTIDVYGNVKNKLVETIAPNQSGDNYRIKLREDIYWHDHTQQRPHKLTSKDIEATFKLFEELDFNSGTKTIYSRIANKRIKFVPIEGDDYRFEFQLEGAIPNFYELITFKILPASLINELNSNNILTNEPFINRNPIGTGRYKLAAASEDLIQLTRNDNYYDKELLPNINDIKFKFFINEESIINALENGQIHSFAGITIEGSNSTGRIQIVSEALNNEPTTISNRAIAKIRFQIKAQKTSELTIQQDDSNLLLNSVDVLDDTTLEPLEIRSGGTLTPTPSNIFPTNIPDTALDNPQSFALVGIGVFLVIAGVLLKNKIEERRKKHES